MNYHALVQSITALHADSVGRAASAVNQALVLRNWLIGAYVVEFEQHGEDRAAYGQGLLRRLSADLGSRGVKGVSPDMLERMRLFFQRYPQLADTERIQGSTDLRTSGAEIRAERTRASSAGTRSAAHLDAPRGPCAPHP